MTSCSAPSLGARPRGGARPARARGRRSRAAAARPQEGPHRRDGDRQPPAPVGSTLSLSQRFELARLADERRFWIIEDDVYKGLWTDDEEPPTIDSLLPQRTLYVSSFSKTLGPALRIGFHPRAGRAAGPDPAPQVPPDPLRRRVHPEHRRRVRGLPRLPASPRRDARRARGAARASRSSRASLSRSRPLRQRLHGRPLLASSSPRAST